MVQGIKCRPAPVCENVAVPLGLSGPNAQYICFCKSELCERLAYHQRQVENHDRN